MPRLRASRFIVRSASSHYSVCRAGKVRAAGAVEFQPGVRPMREADLAAVIAIDAVAFGARRTFLLENFFRRAPHLAFVTEDGEGFAAGASRPDRRTDRADCRRERSTRPQRCSAPRSILSPARSSSIFAIAGKDLRANSNGAALPCNGRSCAWRCAMPLRSATPRAHSWWLGRSLVERGGGYQRRKIPTRVASATRCRHRAAHVNNSLY